MTNRAEAQARYASAKAVYQQIALDAAAQLPVTIGTVALPDGTVNVSYSTTMTASGGATPYTWSIANGALPSGLTLNTNMGVITGTPNNPGTFNFTVQVNDAGNPIQSKSKPLSITVTTVPLSTLWPGSAMPGTVDGGVDDPVELGMKFRSDLRGDITSVRFYKAAANTGTHIGDLWTTNGILLATAMFTGETDSGWQQVDFDSPVPINSNTVYVAAYHCNNGHYSEDDNYFSTSGVDNPPLHILANGVAGGNGVYAYGATSTFPNQTYNAANYWIDVVFVNPLTTISPVIESITLSNGVVTVKWFCSSNGTYRLQYCEDLGSNSWIDVLPDVQAAGPTATATNTINNGTAQRFYRVLLMP